MSAWIVSKAHIDFLVAAARQLDVEAYDHGKIIDPEKDPDEFGRILWAENYRSVNFRYDEDKATPEYHYDERFDGFKFKTIAGLCFLNKAVGCYNYQACECNDYEESVAHGIVDSLRDASYYQLERLVPELHSAYEAFPWGFYEFEQIEEAKKHMAEGKDCYGNPIA